MAAHKKARALQDQNLQLWRSAAFDGVVFARGTGMTHPYPRHWHEELHLCAYTHGSGYLGHSGNSYRVNSGDFVITPPGEVHENWVDCKSGISFCGVYIDAATFSEASRQIAGRALTIPDFRAMFVCDKLVGHRFLAMHRAAERSDSRLRQDELLLQFLDVLLSRCSTKAPVNTTLGDERSAVKQARQYIEDNFSESISLAELGQLASLSPFHLHRVFCRDIGMPPHAYQMQVRINRAKQLLRGRHPLSSVAVITGFADQSHLTRNFRRMVGVTPGRFLA